MTGIVQISSAYALTLEFPKKPSPTIYLKKGATAPNDGYLVDQSRLEKCMLAISDLDSTKELLEVKTKYYEERLAAEKILADMKLDAQKKEAEAVEKELKAKIADLDVWYKKPWFVALGTAVIFIAAGVLIP